MKSYTEMSILAMQRSGHHAVIEWIEAMYIKMGRKVLRSNWVNQFGNHLDPFTTNHPSTGDVNKLGIEDMKREFDLLMYNYEDTGHYMLRAARALSNLGPRVHAGTSMQIVIIRDPYNMMASRLKRTREQNLPFTHPPLAAVYLWGDHAELCLQAGSTYINYNKWFSDVDYRKSLCGWLMCEHSDDSMDTISNAGGGSSFTGQTGTGRSLKPLDRWQEFESDEQFIDMFKNHNELASQCDKLFGWHLAFGDGKLFRRYVQK